MDAKCLAEDIRRLGAPTLADAIRSRDGQAGALARLSRSIGSPGDPETLAFAIARDPDGTDEAVRYLEAEYQAEVEAERRARRPTPTLRASIRFGLLSRFWRRLV